MSIAPAWVQLPDRYRILGHIANGGMASVWKAHDELLGRDVAVKLLATHLSEDPRSRERFLREARAAAGLSAHPNVVTIYDVGEHEGRSFIVMELLGGGTVGDRLRRTGKPPRETALRWLAEAAAALDAAHEAGIVHRDIKPANLLLDDKDRLAIADFGIARLALEDQLTATGQVLGTAAYISPEQAAGEPSTPASDRYALAVVAFELLTGARPFQAEHFAAQARMHIEDEPPVAHDVDPAVPPAASEVLRRGMSKNPELRWESAAAFVAALESAAGAPPAARTETTRVMGASAPRPPAGRVPAAPPPGPGRGPARWIALGLIALIALALVAILSSGGDDGERDPAPRETRSEPRQESTPAEGGEEPTATATPESEGGGDIADARRLHNQAFAANNAGDHARALELERQALEICGDGGPIDPCGYALYEAGRALNALGRPQEAIPLLERRLERYGDNDAGDVQRELDAAREALEGGGGKKDKKDKGKDSDD